MENARDYVLLSRGYMDQWKVWNKLPKHGGFGKLQAFLDLIFRYQEYLEDPGPFQTSREDGGRYEISVGYLMRQWGWENRRDVYRFLNELRDLGFIKYEKRRVFQTTVLAIEVLYNDDIYRFE